MDPHRNIALNSAKIRTILQSASQNSATSRRSEETDDMPAPPAYHTVVDPHAPLPNMRNPYDAVEEDEKDEEETPEITINAATQVRGNGNIISIAQMDSVRIANLIAVMLNTTGSDVEKGEATGSSASATSTSTSTSTQTQTRTQTLPSLASLTAPPKPPLRYPKINITVNCGATVIGDRNIVGPGLGDIARQMQVAQRNQAMQAQRQATESRESLYSAQASIANHHGLFGSGLQTPPMSRSGSEEGAAKRKAEDMGN
ncbi:DUF1925 domain-containing protein, partial [Escherichia coli]|uniref:DUF1925 domain-containing protein n=1 Tax=Escherichia coli TaxID=562 RepID=UPI00200E2EDF